LHVRSKASDEDDQKGAASKGMTMIANGPRLSSMRASTKLPMAPPV
jgi:hypothetical protein